MEQTLESYVGPDGTMRGVNGAWQALLGLPAASLEGSFFPNLIHLADHSRMLKLFAGASTSGRAATESLCLRQDGSWLAVRWEVELVGSPCQYRVRGQPVDKAVPSCYILVG